MQQTKETLKEKLSLHDKNILPLLCFSFLIIHNQDANLKKAAHEVKTN